MDDVVFENIRLEPEFEYFLYVGEIKAHGLNDFVRRGLERRFGRPFRAITVCPDVLETYPVGNILAANPWLARAPGRTAGRRPMGDFAHYLSCDRYFRALLERLLAAQGRLFVWMFETRQEFLLRDVRGVTLLGPDPAVVHAVNDKTWQYRNLSGVVPMADFEVCTGRAAMLEACGRMGCSCGQRVFVSCPYSAAGAASMVVSDPARAGERFDQDGCFLVSRYVPHVWDPTVLGVVGNEREVFVAGVADMTIEDGNKFRGSTFPSLLPARVQGVLREHTVAVGRVLGRMGFRGIFGCDFIVAPDESVYFIEVNPRKQGTTMEFCCTLEHLLPDGAPNLPELEICAVLDGRFPEGMPSGPDGEAAGRLGLHWGTYNHKIEIPGVRTTHAVLQDMPERDLFRRVAADGPGGAVVLEHVGGGVAVLPGTFLGRVAAVAPTREQMLAALAGGRNQLAASITGA
jgi:hypothetical protein